MTRPAAGEPHAGVDAPAAAHGGQARAVAQVRQDHAALRGRGIEPAEFLHQICIGQAVETVALDAPGRIAPRDRQQPGDPRQRAVKGGVEARHLRQPGMPPPERLDQLDLARQVIGVVRRDAAQFREQPRRDPFRRRMPHAVHHAVAHGPDRREDRLLLQPAQQEIHRRAVVGGGHADGRPRLSRRLAGGQIRAAQTDAIDLPGQPPPRPCARLKHREPDARRSAVDGQDAGQRRFHESVPVMTPPVHGFSWESAFTPHHEGQSPSPQWGVQPKAEIT